MDYPIQLNLAGRSILIVGAGSVGSRKCKDLILAGADILVVAPKGEDIFLSWEESGKIRWEHRLYQASDLGGKDFIFVATDNEEVNRQVVAEATEQRLWVNSADGRHPGNFTLPAKHRQGELLLTVSTGGESPGVSRQLKEELQKNYGPIWQDYLQLIGDLRKELLTAKTSKEREAFWREILTPEILVWVREGRIEEVEAKIRDAARGFGNQSS